MTLSTRYLLDDGITSPQMRFTIIKAKEATSMPSLDLKSPHILGRRLLARSSVRGAGPTAIGGLSRNSSDDFGPHSRGITMLRSLRPTQDHSLLGCRGVALRR